VAGPCRTAQICETELAGGAAPRPPDAGFAGSPHLRRAVVPFRRQRRSAPVDRAISSERPRVNARRSLHRKISGESVDSARSVRGEVGSGVEP
jgi:hypothetical protein